MSMSLTKSFSLSLNDCKEPGKMKRRLSPLLMSRLMCINVTSLLLSSLYSLPLADMSPADTLSVSSQLDEVCVRVLVRIGDQLGVSSETI